MSVSSATVSLPKHGYTFHGSNLINPFQPSVAFYIETSHLIFIANQIIGFCMKWNTRLKWVKARTNKSHKLQLDFIRFQGGQLKLP